MMSIGKSSLTGVVFAALMFVVVGCGSNDNSTQTGTATPTPTPTPLVLVTPTPTPAANSITCTSKTLAAGVKVFYSGTKGTTTFPDANKAYIGTVVSLFTNGSASVQFDTFTAQVAWSNLNPEATCSKDITGYSTLYTGTQAAANANFPDPHATYLGKIVNVFAGGNAQVNWDHLTYDTVESFSNIAIQQ